jgi:hypothetical protein
MSQLVTTQAEGKDKIGLVDGGHTFIKCSACGKGLLDIFHTQPKAVDPKTKKPFKWRIKALCCYCGDHSYITEVFGKFHLGGYGKIKEDDPTEDIPETFPDKNHTEKDEHGEILVIKTVKARK